jgi:CDP-diacylglycerol--glycerol-3-phosphate 3-phosphatidyltransferase
MKKHLANAITCLRIIGSIVLSFLDAASVPFRITYLLCGVTDMIDGTVARKTNAVSRFGSKLDTAADFAFMAVCAVKLLPGMSLSAWLWIWIALVAMIKAVNLVGGFVRTRMLVDHHTVLNKITGLLLFLLPFTVSFIEPRHSLAAVCAVATVAAAQETYSIVKNIRA